MDHAARCAFVIAQAACVHAQVAAMQAANQAFLGGAQVTKHLPYKEADFLAVEVGHLIGHNAVIEYLRDG
jgi:hypothetical protein